MKTLWMVAIGDSTISTYDEEGNARDIALPIHSKSQDGKVLLDVRTIKIVDSLKTRDKILAGITNATNTAKSHTGWIDMATLFRYYNLNDNIKDVEAQLGIIPRRDVDMALRMKLIGDKLSQNYGWITSTEMKAIDQHNKVNARGVKIDTQLAANAQDMVDQLIEELKEEEMMITGKSVGMSNKALQAWLAGRGINVSGTSKDVIEEAILSTDDTDARRVMEIRSFLNMTSLSKYDAFAQHVETDDHVRDMLKIYGAQKTGRWSSHGVQLHNFPNTNVEGLSFARTCVKDDDLESLELTYFSPLDVLSQLSSSAFIPSGSDRSFVIADYKAIEARVLAWLADEDWRLLEFKGEGKIYEASASRMFGVNIEDVSPEQRRQGKIAELALGYGGGINALRYMGMKHEDDDILKQIVYSWRRNNPSIETLWQGASMMATLAITSGQKQSLRGKVTFEVIDGTLTIELPSGRKLYYHNITCTNGEISCYNRETGDTQKYYGGRLVENITQAIARDIIAEAMLAIEALSPTYEIVMHIHDEVVVEVDTETLQSDLESISRAMTTPRRWAKDIPLGVEAISNDYYTK